jgi:hypothetical protein
MGDPEASCPVCAFNELICFVINNIYIDNMPFSILYYARSLDDFCRPISILCLHIYSVHRACMLETSFAADTIAFGSEMRLRNWYQSA